MGFRNFMEEKGGWILAALSSVGVIITSVLAADEAPKAKQAIEDERVRRFEEDPELSLSTWDKIKISTPIMLPSLISGGLTIGGIITNQVFNTKKQNGLALAAAGYSVLQNEYDQYRKVIRETQSEDVDQEALRLAKMKCEELEDELARLKEENGPYLYSIATIPGLIFEANPADIQEAFLHFNRNLVLRGTNDLAELYSFIGIPENYYNQDESFRYGWNEYTNQVEWDSSFVDFDIEEVSTANDTVVRVITMAITPYDLTVDYTDENVMDHDCPSYSFKRTREYIAGSAQIYWDQVLKINHPYIYSTGII